MIEKNVSYVLNRKYYINNNVQINAQQTIQIVNNVIKMIRLNVNIVNQDIFYKIIFVNKNV